MSINLATVNQPKYHTSTLKQGGFTFKRFFVAHDKSPMKITSDSVLLGAWAPLDPLPKHVLDIGTGCGVIALMLAQRLNDLSDNTIDAIDIDLDAVLQCQENISNSPFTHVSVKQQDIKLVLTQSVQQRYDLIVCNPPYFQTAVACRSQQRQTARYTEQLTHAELCQCVAKLLTEKGLFCVVLPYHLVDEFIEVTRQSQLYLSTRLDVRYTEDKNYSLVLCCFSRIAKNEYERKDLCMRHLDKSYTEEFAILLKDFYLRF